MSNPNEQRRRSPADLRTELLREASQLRDELHRKTAQLRDELRRETAELQYGLTQETAELRRHLREAEPRRTEVRAPAGLSRQGRRVWEYFEKGRRDYLQGVEEGVVVLTHPREIRGLLRMLTEEAREEILAVDHIAIENWFRIDLKRYLDLQLSKARNGLHVQRIRLFDPSELANRYQRELLKAFLEVHRDAGADLVLCPLDENVRARFDSLLFFPKMGSYPRTGCLLIDKESELTSFRGIVGENGFITTAEVDLTANQPARRCLADYEELLREIKKAGTHERTLRALASGQVDSQGVARSPCS